MGCSPDILSQQLLQHPRVGSQGSVSGEATDCSLSAQSSDLGLKNRHSGSCCFLQSDHRDQQHHGHKIHRVRPQREVSASGGIPKPQRTPQNPQSPFRGEDSWWFLSDLCPFSCSCFLINTADRIIRVYDGREILTCGRDGEPEPMQKLQDLVNRWGQGPGQGGVWGTGMDLEKR